MRPRNWRDDGEGDALVDYDFGLGHALLLAKAATRFPDEYADAEAELLLVASQNAMVQRSLAHRRADAFEEMASAYGPQEDGTEIPTEPHGRHAGATIEAVINLDFAGNTSLLGEMHSDLYRTGPVPHTIIEQLSCDASWRRVLVGASQILDYSSPVADITPNQRRAIRNRDRNCQFHGCDRSWLWCDMHHIISRHDGGPTTIDNLTLVCRHHHSLIHQAGWSLTRNPQTGQTQTTSP